MSQVVWSAFSVAVVLLYGLAAAYLILYGLHMYVLTWLFRKRHAPRSQLQSSRIEWYAAERPDGAWPVVTSQVPLYNEANVADRVIRAVAAMDYPNGRHEIQVLDDSTDETRLIVDRVAEELRQSGRNVVVVRRPNRTGYKAGALAYGLSLARGDVITIFDADFVPPSDFLRRGVPLLMDEPENACVQGRWSHLNEKHSWLTRAQSLAIDGHFAVEQGGRSWNQLFMNFNGTAGLWRREAIEDPAVGGWTADTLTEDLDLSYRTQLAGWKIEYCMDLACPSELPETIPALKTQQFRWAKGSLQCARKLLLRIWRSRLPMSCKFEATMHLTGYSVSVWMLTLGLLCFPLYHVNPYRALGGWMFVLVALMWIGLSGPPVAHAYSRRVIQGRWSGVLASPLLMILGVGICLSTSIACVSGLFRRGGEFVRTPKSGDAERDLSGSEAKPKRYRLRSSPVWMLELAAAAYCGFSFWYFVTVSEGIVGTFLAIFTLGFAIVGWKSRPESLGSRRRAPAVEERTSPVTAPALSLQDE
ncbi:MAG: glycosyltransferase [Phycisphaerales bacterium]|nr:glycosyltransferase [Phycisphaerales bacterium]